MLKPKSRVRPLLLLGGKSWNTPELTALGGNLVEGAVVVAPYVAEAASAFARAFKVRWNVDPTYVDAFAYDAYRLLHWAANREQARDAAAMGKALVLKDRASPRAIKAPSSCDVAGDPRDLYCPIVFLKVTEGELKILEPNVATPSPTNEAKPSAP